MDEKGTGAAAVTSACSVLCAGPDISHFFTFDRPFSAFVCLDNKANPTAEDRHILFAAQVNAPLPISVVETRRKRQKRRKREDYFLVSAQKDAEKHPETCSQKHPSAHPATHPDHTTKSLPSRMSGHPGIRHFITPPLTHPATDSNKTTTAPMTNLSSHSGTGGFSIDFCGHTPSGFEIAR